MVINIIMNGYTNTIVRKRQGTFHEWQERNMKDLGGDIKHDGKNVKNIEYLNYFHESIRSIIISTGYTIINEKEFRNKIGSLLYRISE